MYFEIILTQINIFDKKISTNSSNQRGEIWILLTSILSSTQFLVLVIKNDGGYRSRPNYNRTTTFCPRNQRMCRSTRYVDLWECWIKSKRGGGMHRWYYITIFSMRLEAFDNVNQLDLVILCHENVEDMMDFCTERRFLGNCHCCVS